jgi:hypothetical protein
VIADTIGMFEISTERWLVHHACTPSTRIVISTLSPGLVPACRSAASAQRQPVINYIATADFST